MESNVSLRQRPGNSSPSSSSRAGFPFATADHVGEMKRGIHVPCLLERSCAGTLRPVESRVRCYLRVTLRIPWQERIRSNGSAGDLPMSALVRSNPCTHMALASWRL